MSPLVSVRTLDFGDTFNSYLVCAPKKSDFPELAPPDGKKWQNDYGFVAVKVGPLEFMPEFYTDGLNEAGLSAAAMWLPGTNYSPPVSTPNTNIYMTEVVAWALGCCGDVQTVKSKIESGEVQITGFSIDEKFPPFHFIFQDANWNALIVECTNQKTHCYEQSEHPYWKKGVLSNAPPFDWQYKNLSNFENLQPKNNSQIWWGQEVNGSGLLGLPGDATPPSRFVRASKMAESKFHLFSSQQNEQQAVALALQLASTLLVPIGSVTTEKEDKITHEKKEVIADYTQWVLVRNHTDKKLYFCTAFNHILRCIDFSKLNFSPGSIKTMLMEQTQWPWVLDVTKDLK